MATLLTTVCFQFLVMEVLIGMLANGFIVLINIIDWFRSRKLSPTDLILIFLSLSRLLLQAVVILDVIFFTLLNNTPRNMLFILTSAWVFTDIVNLSFAACLSVFYLAKIAVFSHPVFLQVKRRFSGLVPRLLLGSVVFSAVATIIVNISWSYGLPTCYKSLSSNRSNPEMNLPHMCRQIPAITAAFDIIPFMVFLSSSVFLISSLWKHMRRVQHSETGTRDISTQAHLSAIKALASFGVLYLISFAASNAQLVLFWSNRANSWSTVFFNVSAAYPSGHAIMLILMNPKLKQAWVRMIHRLKCRLSRIPT